MIRALWTLRRALRGAMPDPRVAEAVRQQRAVAGDTHSRKVHEFPCFCDACYRDTCYRYAGMYAELELYDLAACSAIAASGSGITRVVEEAAQ